MKELMDLPEDSQVYEISSKEKRRALCHLYLVMVVILGLTFVAMGMQWTLMLHQVPTEEGATTSVGISYVPSLLGEQEGLPMKSPPSPFFVAVEEEKDKENRKEVEEMERKLFLGRTYRHFKGKHCLPIMVATNVDTTELMVIYQQLENGEMYARRVEEFLSPVDKEKYPLAEQEWRLEEV